MAITPTNPLLLQTLDDSRDTRLWRNNLVQAVLLLASGGGLLNAVLTGYKTVAASQVTASDTVLTAIQKLQAQITAI